MITLYQDPENNNGDKVWAAVFILTLLLLMCTMRCSAQKTQAKVDTVYCNPAYVVKYVQIEGSTGKMRTYAVYKDVKNNIQDLIPVSQSVMEYIKLCKQNGIESTLGIRIRNGQISSLVKYKNKFIVK
jgi:hypothetical protein